MKAVKEVMRLRKLPEAIQGCPLLEINRLAGALLKIFMSNLLKIYDC